MILILLYRYLFTQIKCYFGMELLKYKYPEKRFEGARGGNNFFTTQIKFHNVHFIHNLNVFQILV